MVVLGLILVASSAVWPSGANRASAAIETEKWANLSSIEYGSLQDVAYGNNVWIAVGESGTILRSTDTVNWTRVWVGTDNDTKEQRTFYGVEYLNGTWFAVGTQGIIYTSSNGLDWQFRTAGQVSPNNELYSVSSGLDAQGEPVYIALGQPQISYVSQNGTNWSIREAETGINYWIDIAYGNGQFLSTSKKPYIGYSNSVSKSVYGETWSSAASVPGAASGIVFEKDRFVVVDPSSSNVHYSEDGTMWNTDSITNAPYYQFSDIAYNQEYANLMVVGNSNMTDSSVVWIGNIDDGWVEETIAPGYYSFNGLAANGENAVLVGGNGNLFARGVTLSTDNTLSSLTVSDTQLNEPFVSNQFDYTATVPSNAMEVDITPVTTSVYATVEVNGNAVEKGKSYPIILAPPGIDTEVKIRVTPQSKEAFPQTYNLTIKRKSDTLLSNLTISEGTLDPTFTSANLYYSAEVASNINNLNVTPTVETENASIQISVNNSLPVEGISGQATNVPLREGFNRIEVTVSSPNPNNPYSSSYQIYITREYSAYLKNLTVDKGTLNPIFDPLEKEYKVYVDNEVSEIKVTPTAASETAEITVNGQPTVSEGVYTAQLQEGLNEIVIEVTNQMYEPKSSVQAQLREPAPTVRQEYRIVVDRAGKEPNPFLGSLTIDPGTLDQTFDPEREQYTATVSNSVYTLNVTAASIDPDAAITINGVEADSGKARSLPLNVGVNEINVQVTVNGDVRKSYTIRVTRESAPFTPGPSDPGTTTPVTPTPTTPAPTPTTPTPTAPANGLEVLVNGQPTTVVATGGPAQVNGQTVFTATIDTARLTSYLAGTTGSPTVTIPVRTEADRVIATLTGEAAALLNSRNATLRIESPLGNYTIPSSQIRLGTAANTLGVTEGSANLNVNVMIEKSGAAVQNTLSQAAASGGFTAASEPIDFMITASSGDRTVEVNSFTEYVEREIPLPAGTNSNQITTAVVIEDNGTVRHVPTAVTRTGSNDYARVNSLTNSSYALIWNPKQFSDVAGKWSQASVNDMASRMVVNGVGNDRYNPEGAVTRAEFAAILVRALGLPTSGQTNGFSDVAASDWYAGAASTANAYGLITGYPNGTFAPNATITRQEAFAILDRATQIVPLQPSDSGSELSSYRDRADVASWARTSTQAILASGLVEGSGGWLRPEATLSRAESAAVAQRLLQQGGLID